MCEMVRLYFGVRREPVAQAPIRRGELPLFGRLGTAGAAPAGATRPYSFIRPCSAIFFQKSEASSNCWRARVSLVCFAFSWASAAIWFAVSL